MSRITLALATALSLAFTPLAAQESKKALDAYEAGDYATALKEWRPLADQGNANAQFNLVMMYENGKGVPQNYVQAVKWYRLAAGQGIDKAQFNLGYMYENGNGVPKVPVMAHMWYNLAAANGFDGADDARDEMAESISIAVIKEAQALADECMNSGYKNCGY